MKEIRFKFAPHKARAAIHWMVRKAGTIDVHALLKACYFADRTHLNEHHRPVFGATYRAMKYGPVPLEIYEMVKGEMLWLAEMECERLPWRTDGHRVRLEDNAEPDISVLSESDFGAIQSGFAKSCRMTFNERTAATHGLDWQKANLGIMKYEDMIEEIEGKNEVVEYLREAAPYMRL